MDELRRFFTDLEIPEIKVDEYIVSLLKTKISTLKDLLVIASIENLERLNIGPADIVEILRLKNAMLRKEFKEKLESLNVMSSDQVMSSPKPKKVIDDTADDISFIQPIERTYISRLTRDRCIILREIGHGASGRVSKALYCPSLTFMAIKRIEIENPAHRVVVGQELKALYEIARCKSIGNRTLATAPSDLLQSSNEETHLNLLSGEPYSEIIAGSPSETNIKELPLGPKAVIKAANNPYILDFYDAYIDPEHGAVCLILEYMNCGSIQSMLNDGIIFDEDDAAVLAFSVLTALTDFHSRNILHRDIKPSNILTDTAGRIKLTDCGITKEITEDGPAAESFIGTLAYMSPARINGLTEYSFEADMWSLGITMITVMTGRIPFPTAHGSWQLMNAILKGPQPTITTADVSSELHDFIHLCLNQLLRDKSGAQKLLDHVFLTSAKDRGILSVHKPAILAKRGKLMNFDLPTNSSMERIVEEAISWQLEQMEDQWLEDPESLIEHKSETFIRSISRFSASDVEWLAIQMGAQNSVLEDKFNIKYALIDKALGEGCSIEAVHSRAWRNSFRRSRRYPILLNIPIDDNDIE